METTREMIKRLRELTVSLPPTPISVLESAIFILDGSKFVDCDQNALKMFRCGREDLIDHYPGKLSPQYQKNGEASLSEANQHIINAYGKDGWEEFDWIHNRFSGEPFSTRVVLNRITVGGKVYLLAIVTEDYENSCIC